MTQGIFELENGGGLFGRLLHIIFLDEVIYPVQQLENSIVKLQRPSGISKVMKPILSSNRGRFYISVRDLCHI
jgi:hypothetical protein